jgi:hypothetical protein
MKKENLNHKSCGGDEIHCVTEPASDFSHIHKGGIGWHDMQYKKNIYENRATHLKFLTNMEDTGWTEWIVAFNTYG